MRNTRYDSRLLLLFTVALAVILVAVILSVRYADIIYFNAGFTVVLVIVTAWYSATLYSEASRSEKSRVGRVIAEIARSVFSAMRNDLVRIEYQLSSGNYLRSLKPITIADTVRRSPSHYLNDEITVQPPNSQIAKDFLYGEIQRPAPQLLDIPDETLTKNHLPVIQALCKDYDKNLHELRSVIEETCMKTSPIWQDFKDYCLSIDDQHSFQDFLLQKNPSNSNETYFCTLFRAVISEADISDVEYTEFTAEGGVRVSDKSAAFKIYYAENKDSLLAWLKESGLQNEIDNHKRIKQNLLAITRNLNTEINSLFLAWKMEYYLTEDEMNIQLIRGI